jgi:putative ABC transport system substrate-binding protein
LPVGPTNRRAFIAALGGAVAWPVMARGQKPAMPVIGFVSAGSPGPFTDRLGALRNGLKALGFEEGRNVAFEYRWLADAGYDHMSLLAADLVARRVNVIVAGGGAAAAAKQATTTIPIVALSGGDPIKAGLVASLNRPEGNLTGVVLFAFSLGGKRFQILREAVPDRKLIAVLINPNNPDPETKTDANEVVDVARAAGQKILMLNASSAADIDVAFAKMVEQSADALLVMADPILNNRREQIIALAAHHRMPAIYEWRETATAGGLMSYGSSLIDAYRQLGVYAGRILRGATPADLPIQQAVKIELVLNMKTAKTLGIAFPITLLGRADEVIE